MKKHIAWLFPILIGMFALAPVSANAQSATGARANVPFDFIVGDKTFSAGLIVANGPAGDAGAMSVSNLKSGQHVFRTAQTVSGATESDDGKLVFRKYGTQYYLAQVWIPGYKAFQVSKSKSERAIERELRLARNSKPTPELVVVMAYTR